MSTKKKIVLFASSNIVYDQRMIKVCTSLQSNNFDICFVGRNKCGKALNNKFSFEVENLKCWFNKGFLFYLEFNLRIAIYMFYHKADIFTANDLDTVLGVFLGKKFNKNTKLVFDAHEYFTEVPELKNKAKKKQIWQWIETKFLPKFDAFYTVNNSLAAIFEKNLNISFQVIKNVAFLKKTKKPYKKNIDKYILYQGALNKARGLEQMIAAMPRIDLQLQIAGSGDIEAELKQQVETLGLQNKVIFLGNLEPEKLLSVTQNAFIGINLLENTSLNYYYSLANKFFDYMHQDIPQICMNFPEYKAINAKDEVAVLIKNLDQQVIINAVKKLSNENFYKKMQQNCKRAKSSYTWQNEEAKLLEIYSKI
ncbi:MAG: glycosyltransferase [Chitinophagales bacterium]